MISGAAQADAAVLMLPADGNFTVSIQKGNFKTGEVQGQSRAHGRLLCLLGLDQMVICVNKMDSDTVRYEEKRFLEIVRESKIMLLRVGWKTEYVMTRFAFIPISGYEGENLMEESDKMPWWRGVCVYDINGKSVFVVTLLDVLDRLFGLPERDNTKPVRLPVSGLYKIKGVGDVLTGRVEQGQLKSNDEVVFLPSHNRSRSCGGKVFSIEMHHTKTDVAQAGDNVGVNVKGLEKKCMPRTGDVMILRGDSTLYASCSFLAHVQTLDNIANQITVGYCPIGYVRCSRGSCRIENIL